MKYGLKVELDEDNGLVIATVVDRDNNSEAIASREYDAQRVHESLRGKVALYGLSKLIQDRTSDQSVKELGEAKLDAMDAVVDRLGTGEWAAERRVGAPTVSAEVEALAQIKGVEVSVMQTSLRAYSKEQRQAILANDQVQAKAAEIKAARESAAPVDLSDLAG